ncbi:MAG: hypothetical protein ABJI96_16230 [Paracoccaceae bacterium]
MSTYGDANAIIAEGHMTSREMRTIQAATRPMDADHARSFEDHYGID